MILLFLCVSLIISRFSRNESYCLPCNTFCVSKLVGLVARSDGSIGTEKNVRAGARHGVCTKPSSRHSHTHGTPNADLHRAAVFVQFKL